MPLHLYVPPSIRRLQHDRLYSGPGLRHSALEYDLAASVRPKLVVDLGAGDAASFFAFCQAMVDHDVDGICYAFDVWGQEPEARSSFDAISATARKRFSGISYLLNLSPSEARRHFDEGTVDLLRVDGTRSEVMVGADVEAWFRIVRPGGLLLWHGAASNPGLWSLVASRCRSVVFSEGRGGLGLALKGGSEPTAELLKLLFVEDEAADLESFYRHVFEHLDFARILEATARAK